LAPPCYVGLEISPACITERGLDPKAALYRRKVDEAMARLGAAYKISLRIVNNPAEAGFDAESVSDVFTDVVRNEEMRNESFIINVSADFLERQPEILFEASSLHEVCHVMNDDLTGYHRNGVNIEAAEEHCVLETVGEPRYQEYLRAYARYRHWDAAEYELCLKKVKDVVLVPAPTETDEADRIAAEYFRNHAGGKEQLLVYNGELHDVTLSFAGDRLQYDSEKMRAVIQAGKPLVFFHNHPAGGGRSGMFPTRDDFEEAGLLSFLAYREDPQVPVEFRVVELGDETAIVSFGFIGTALDEIRRGALEYRAAVARGAALAPIERRQSALDSRLAAESLNDYMQHACPADHPGKGTRGCNTHPQYFLWPSDRFFIHYRAH